MIFCSYNIRTSAVDETTRSDRLNNWQYRRQAVANLLVAQNADFIGLQEDTAEQRKFVADCLGSDYQAFPTKHQPDSANPEYNTLFVRVGADIEASGLLWISFTPEIHSCLAGSLCARHLVWVVIRDAGRRFLVVNTHLDHSEDAEFKAAEAILFRFLIDRLCRVQCVSHVIVLGDMNCPPQITAYTTLVNDWQDASAIADNDEPTHPRWLMWDTLKHIDYFFASYGFRLAAYTIVKDKYVRADCSLLEPSDHFLIRCTVELLPIKQSTPVNPDERMIAKIWSNVPVGIPIGEIIELGPFSAGAIAGRLFVSAHPARCYFFMRREGSETIELSYTSSCDDACSLFARYFGFGKKLTIGEKRVVRPVTLTLKTAMPRSNASTKVERSPKKASPEHHVFVRSNEGTESKYPAPNLTRAKVLAQKHRTLANYLVCILSGDKRVQRWDRAHVIGGRNLWKVKDPDDFEFLGALRVVHVKRPR